MTKDELLGIIREAAESRQEKLDLIAKGLTELPPEIGQLTSLRELDLSHNGLTSLPPEIGKLTGLTALYLDDNNLTKLPPEIGQLTNLSVLIVPGNKLAAFPPEICQLHSIKRLYLAGNQITALPLEIRQLNLIILQLKGNPLPIPPEILDKSDEPASIINYYFEHQAGQKKPLNEAKVLVLGQGNVGKTSLVRRLMGGRFNPGENKTEGIDIQQWHVAVDGQDVRLNVWDFGGQEIMHATHQFFLTKRSLYVLVVDARVSEEENRIEYWLKIIQSFGKESPVVVVGNKIDQQRLDLNRSSLQAKYPNIRAFVETSCQTGEGLEVLNSTIVREVGALEHLHDALLVSWFSVKERLEQMEEDFIPFDEYVSMCKAEDIGDKLSRDTLIGFLHDLGIVLNFRDDPRLAGMGILNPEWVTKGVYKILNSHVLFQNKGVLERRSLGQILDPQKYPEDKHLFIMDLMRKFELCFDFEGLRDERFLIPDLLTREEPDTGDWGGALAFQYHYSVLPTSIISRFIVRMQRYINRNTLWRTGVVLKNDDGNRALIRADIEDRKIFIWVGGPESSRRRFLEVVRSHFDSIHRTIPGLAADEKVPLPSHPEIAVDYKHLLRLEQEGIERWIPEGLVEPVIVKQLLDGIETEQARRDRQELRIRKESPERLRKTSTPRPPAPESVEANDAKALRELTRVKNNLDANSERFAKRCLYAYLMFLVAVGAVLAGLVYWLGWETMEAWTWGVSITAAISGYGYCVVTLREFSPRGIYDHLVERKKVQNYKAAGFDLKAYERLTEQQGA